MPHVSGKQAPVYAVLVFVITLILSYFLPGYAITLSGLLVVIFLSVFVHTKGATVIAGGISSLVVIAFMILETTKSKSFQLWNEYFFILLLIGFTTLIVLYIRQLIRRMQFDKSHMTSLFENATEGIVVTNNSGHIMLVNPAACKMFDYKAEDLIDQPVETLIPSQYRQGHVSLRDNFYRHPQNRQMGFGRDLTAQKKDGKTFPVEVSLSTYTQQNRHYVIAFVVDITHRKEIENSVLQQQQQLEQVTNDIRKLNAELEAKVEERTVVLKEALQRLEQWQQELSEALGKERQLNEIKSRFVSMASHEFRTPLSTVLSSAALLAKYTTAEQQPNRDKHINRIKDSVKHLNDLLEDFLSLGKLDEGKIGADLNEFNLPETIQDTVEDVRGLVKPGQHILFNHTGADWINSDKKLLKNILINLISNALKFSPDNKDVWVNSSVQNGSVVIAVKDEGIGIPEEDQEHLFSSFFRGKNALNIQGTGLGLHIVKRYLDLLGGKVHLDSSLNKGTTITFTIPVNSTNYAKNNFSN